MSPRRGDLADRYLALVVRCLPAGRRDWGRAMQAELSVIDAASERRRFALGCTRVALEPSSEVAVRPLMTALVIALALGGEGALASVVGPAVPLAGALLLLAWLGRRPGYLGPVRPEVGSRLVRAGGFALAGFFVVAQVVHDGSAFGNGGAVIAVLATLVAALFLALTATSVPGVVAGAAAGVVAGAAAFVVLPFERIGTPLAHGLPGHGRWLALLVFALPIAAALLTGVRTLRADAAVVAALTAGAVAALLVAELGLGAIVLFPHSVPDIVGPVMVPGTSEAQKLAANATEASDPCVGLWVFGALLAALLWVTARPPVRAGSTVGLLFLLGVPPIWLASVNSQFPGSAAIASGTALAVVGALVTTRPGLAAADAGST